MSFVARLPHKKRCLIPVGHLLRPQYYVESHRSIVIRREASGVTADLAKQNSHFVWKQSYFRRLLLGEMSIIWSGSTEVIFGVILAEGSRFNLRKIIHKVA